MARAARYEAIDPSEVQVIHSVNRCVRRARLCGKDPYSGEDYEHRREWIRQRLEFLASVMGIDCLTYTVLHNHLHVVLRSRPDIVATWSDTEVARRWLRLFPQRRDKDGAPAEPNEAELNLIVNNPQVLAERRKRLSDVSWWMRCTAENIARKANREDECTGRFWEGRFKAQLILDEASLLACAMYVDLNPIRAAICKTPEQSEFTGAKNRIDDLREREAAADAKTHDWERSWRRQRSGWMSPIEIDEKFDGSGADVDSSGRRASLKGFLTMSLTSYLQLLDWTGRELKASKRGSIPAELEPILDRLGLDAIQWCRLVEDFGRIFKRAAGRGCRLAEEAKRRGKRWICAKANPLS